MTKKFLLKFITQWYLQIDHNSKQIDFLVNYTTPYVCTERDFDSRPFIYNNIFLKKFFIEVGSSYLYASFDTFCVQIGPLFEAQWDFKLSEEFKIDVIFRQKQRFHRFETFSKGLLCLQKLTNLDAKGVKRSWKMWATNFYKSFFKNILSSMKGGLSKIRSVHWYGLWSMVDSCFWEAV